MTTSNTPDPIDRADVMASLHAALLDVNTAIDRAPCADEAPENGVVSVKLTGRQIVAVRAAIKGAEWVVGRAYADSGVMWYMRRGHYQYYRSVDISVQIENDYGADADGRRGARVRFLEATSTRDSPPPTDSPDYEDWLNLVPSPESLVSDWSINYRDDE